VERRRCVLTRINTEDLTSPWQSPPHVWSPKNRLIKRPRRFPGRRSGRPTRPREQSLAVPRQSWGFPGVLDGNASRNAKSMNELRANLVSYLADHFSFERCADLHTVHTPLSFERNLGLQAGHKSLIAGRYCQLDQSLPVRIVPPLAAGRR
jgi:hypothetical protein